MIDNVNHPKHYTAHPSGIECIQVTEHMSFTLGNAMKYLFRLDLKHADLVIDLKKALWYVNRYANYMETLPSRSSLRSFFGGRREESIDKEITEASSDKEWIHDRNVYLSKDSPLFTQDGSRDIQWRLPQWDGGFTFRWKQGKQFDLKSMLGIKEGKYKSQGEAQHISARIKKSSSKTGRRDCEGDYFNQLERIIASRDWREIRSISFSCRTNLEERVMDISKYIGFSDDNITRASFYIWRADLKNGTEDLKKAVWYLNREITKREQQ